MSIFLKAAGVILICSLCGIILHSVHREYKLLLELAAVCCVVSLLLPQLRSTLQLLRGYYSLMGNAGEYFSLFVKAAAVACMSGFAVSACRDTGNTTLAYVTELCGRLGITVVGIPLIKAVLNTVISMLGTD